MILLTFNDRLIVNTLSWKLYKNTHAQSDTQTEAKVHNTAAGQPKNAIHGEGNQLQIVNQFFLTQKHTHAQPLPCNLALITIAGI